MHLYFREVCMLMLNGMRMSGSRSGKSLAKKVVISDAKADIEALSAFLRDDKGFESLFYKSSIPKALSNVITRKFITVNKAWQQYTGYQKSEVIGHSAYDLNLVKLEAGEYIREILGKNQSLKSYEAELIKKNGDHTHALLSFERVSIGENDYVLSEILDISELKKSNILLKAEKEFSQNLIASLQEGLSVVDLNGTHIEVNPALCKMTGFSREELMGAEAPHLYWPPEEYDNINDAFQKTLKGATGNIQLVFMRKNGERFPVSLAISSLNDNDGNTAAYFSTVEDITKRVQAEEELRRANEFSRGLINSMHEGLVVFDLDYKLINVNPAYCMMTGYSEAEMVGTTSPYPISPPEIQKEVNARFKLLQEGKLVDSFESVYVHKKGHRFPVLVSISDIKDDKGKLIAYFGTILNITERIKVKKALQERAERSIQKKDVIIELASLVGHDLKVALRKITSLASKTLDVERVSIWRFNKDHDQITCDKLFIRSKKSYESGAILKEKDNPAYFKALRKVKVINVTNADINEITKGFAEDYLKPNNITSMLDVFVQGHNELYGILCFEHVGHPRVWRAEEEEFASSIGNLVSLMVESTQREEAENKLIELNDKLSATVFELNNLKNQLEDENIYLRNELDLVFNFEEMVYGSAAFSQILTDVENVAPTAATVLLLGETGTGKELLARAVHNISPRKGKPLIKVNCAAIPQELIESELFGHKKGSFTGAVNDKIGKVELAHGGTLFLDEIGELPISMQPKLLRFLQEGEIEKIGDTITRKLDVRIIAATNRNLKEEIKKKQFRQDLYFRLNVFPITVPPLRKRTEDIPLLIEHFVDKFGKIYKKSVKYISDSAMQKMLRYKWPGNIRELENLIERAVILSKGESLVLPDFGVDDQAGIRLIANTGLSLDDAQRNHINNALEKCNWKIDGENGAAKLLKIKSSTLRDRMKKLNLHRPK